MTDDTANTAADGVTGSPADSPDAPGQTGDGYTAVVYFHGMGSQRRYEETSRLIDAIDAFLSNAYRNRNQNLGRLAKIKPRIEPHRTKQGDNVTYIRTRYLSAAGQKIWDSSEVRFYEVYWAPIMAGASSPLRVAKWILRQGIRPWQTLRTVWRERQRLRRSALADLQDDRKKWPEGTEKRDFDTVLRDYTDFGGLASKRDFEKGTAQEFAEFIREKHQGSPETAERLIDLAERWQRHYRNMEFKNVFLILTILLGLGLAGGGLAWSVLQVLQILSGMAIMSEDSFLFSAIPKDWLNPTFGTAAGFVLSLAMTLGMGRFLSDYMGDVEAWATYEETDKKYERRAKVLSLGTELLAHVLADERCTRVMIVSHSLGTSVAHDTLLAMARTNRAVNAQDPISGPIPLEKIRHFVTIASPIDKINYFFESYRSNYHRYTRVVETLRGDISDVPFSRNRHPHIHWVNFWDEADVISGPLHSPVGRTSLAHKVDNVHISNLRFPAPGASHSAYFGNRTVVSKLFGMAYRDDDNFANVPLREDGQGYNYDSALIGPGDARGGFKAYFAAALALPWIGLAYLTLFLLGFGTGAALVLGVFTALSATLFALWLSKGFDCQTLPI